MRSSFLTFSVLLILFFSTYLLSVTGINPPPVFEHKADRNVKGTNCEACQAVVKQALRKIPSPSDVDLSTQKLRRARETKVSEAVESLCSISAFSRYEYSPPTMVTACNEFLSNHGEQLEEYLFKAKATDKEMRETLCIKTKLCKALWTPEQEESKRDKTDAEIKAEADAAQAKRKEEEKAKKAEEKAKKQAEKEKKAAEKVAAEAAGETKPKEEL